MGMLKSAVDISKLGQCQLWVIYGKSNSGKTWVSSTFPKPLLYIGIGDDGSNTIASVSGIKGIQIHSVAELKSLAEELLEDTRYRTVVVDTFSLLTNEWTDEKVIKKSKRMTQQLWGDLKIDTEELIKYMHLVAEKKIVVLTCHESTDSIEGLEDEITPDVRPSVTKGARTYLEGMANYGIHTTKIIKEIQKGATTQEVVRYAADVGPNPYYWTKMQINPAIKLPKRMINPTYDKLMQVLRPEGGENSVAADG